MAAFRKLNNGISLYSANLISSRMNYLFSIYSWMQVLIGPAFTGISAYRLLPMLTDTQSESAPEFISDGQSVVSTGAQIATTGYKKIGG